jgi:hypothetical protein
MLYVDTRKEERRGSINIKSSTELTCSTASITSLPPNTSKNLLPPSQQPILLTPYEGPPQPFTIRVNYGNLPPRPKSRPPCFT